MKSQKCGCLSSRDSRVVHNRGDQRWSRRHSLPLLGVRIALWFNRYIANTSDL